MSRRPSVRTTVVALALAGALAGCGTSTHPTSQAGLPATSSVIARALVDGVASNYVAEPMPAGASTAPVLTGSDAFVGGGYAQVVVTVPDSVEAILVGASGHTGHYVAVLGPDVVARAAARTDKVTRLAQAGQRLGRMSLLPPGAPGTVNVVLALGSVGGQERMPLTVVARYPHSLSRATTHAMTAVRAALADTSARLQVILSWSAPVDLDLHLGVRTGADSTDIFYANREDAGGKLDLDSNPFCVQDGIDNENITWGHGKPDTLSTYTVRVDKYSACGNTAAIPYVLTIIRCDTTIAVVNGTLPAGNGDEGAWNAGTVVRRFDYRPCAWDPRASVFSGLSVWGRSLNRLHH